MAVDHDIDVQQQTASYNMTVTTHLVLILHRRTLQAIYPTRKIYLHSAD
jgi:hypothetical protein